MCQTTEKTKSHLADRRKTKIERNRLNILNIMNGKIKNKIIDNFYKNILTNINSHAIIRSLTEFN